MKKGKGYLSVSVLCHVCVILFPEPTLFHTDYTWQASANTWESKRNKSPNFAPLVERFIKRVSQFSCSNIGVDAAVINFPIRSFVCPIALKLKSTFHLK